MKYIFIFNGLPDRAWVIEEVNRQIAEAKLECEQYITTDAGDATRYVNVYCDFYKKEETCFVACGGAGLANEVMSGIVNRDNKYMAILSYGGTNDFTKVYPEKDFQSVAKMLDGEVKEVDVMKVNDNYCMNVLNIGIDAMVTAFGQEYIAAGVKDAYSAAIKNTVMKYRFTKMTITADGERLNRNYMMDGQIANGKYCGGEYLCAPYAVPDDGLLDFVLFRPSSLVVFAYMMQKVKKGLHLDDKFCMRYIKYRKVKHIVLESKDLIYLALDGEVMAAQYVDINIVPKSLKIILPKQ